MLDQLLGNGGEALALRGRCILHFGEALAQQNLALLVKAAAQIVDNRRRLHTRAPAFEFLDVLGDDRFGARNFGLARALILLDDFAEIVDVVEIKIVEARRVRRDVARNAQIDDENRPPAARGESAFEHLARQHRAGCCRPT